jgi:fucose 4-O-acetylase-like acetyltransferase
MKRQHWIDFLRGICMMAILLDHTEIYYTGENVICYHLYVADALVIFFFLSGYLFLKPGDFSLRHKALSVLKTIIMPYFIFTAVMAIPKALAHGTALSVCDISQYILTGQASWFVAALAVAELLFAVILKWAKGNPWMITVGSVFAFVMSIWLANGPQPYFWQLDNAMQAMLFLCLGYLYHVHENRLNRFFTSSVSIVILGIALVGIKVAVLHYQVSLLIWPIHISNYGVFLVDAIVCILFMTSLCKRIGHHPLIEWTGAHSIVYYFLCGGIPLLTTRLLGHLHFAYQGSYYQVGIVFLLVYLLTTLITWLIYRYIPFVTGRK